MQTVSSVGPSFNRSVLAAVTEELGRKKFALESMTETVAIYRHDEQYIKFTLKDGNLYARIGVGHPEHGEEHIKSMRLDDLIHFLYGSLDRGVSKLGDLGVRECLSRAMRDLWEFAADFLNGDFRTFLHTAALKYRDEHGMLRENIIVGHKKPA